MRKRQLEIMLERLTRMRVRQPSLEQYQTPSSIAADVLWIAHSRGEIEDRDVVDLGCGNGVFCIGAKLLGARRVVAVDVDPEAIRTATENARMLDLDLEFEQSDISSYEGAFDLVLQNPPFGAQTRHADRAFVEKAIQVAPATYSLHNDVTTEFVLELADSFGASSEVVKRYKFEIPYAFEFHRKTREVVSVVLLKFQR